MLANPAGFRLAFAAAVVLAGLCWWVCTVYTHLWNRDFPVTITHHTLCGFASVCTLGFVLLFAGLAHAKDVALASIQLWQAQLNADTAWAQAVFAKSYHKVKDAGVEDFTNFPPPEAGGERVPLTQESSQLTMAETYSNEACQDFSRRRPFLSKIIWSSPGISSEVIEHDVREFFQNEGNVYPMGRAIENAAREIKGGLDVQTPRVVTLSRLIVALLFVMVQAVPFGLIGWAAYRDIRERM